MKWLMPNRLLTIKYQEEIAMPVRKLKKQLRTMLQFNKKLRKQDIMRIRDWILEDGIVSRGERRVIKDILNRRFCESPEEIPLTSLLAK